jgi:hypothetical protein
MDYDECKRLLDTCMNNRHTLNNTSCCYSCLNVFQLFEIRIWNDDTAKCPRCNIESVMSEMSNEKIEMMCKQWCGDHVYYHQKFLRMSEAKAQMKIKYKRSKKYHEDKLKDWTLINSQN